MLCTNETYSDFSLRVHQKGIDSNIPLNGGIEVTNQCNFSCIHCYIRDNSQAVTGNEDGEISFDEYCRIVDQVSAEGCLWLQITGGEPLVRDDFIEIYQYTKKKGILPILFTNGSLISRDIADLLRHYPPFYIDITLYGASEKTYEAVTGKGDNFRKTLDGIALLEKNNIRFNLKSVLIRQNVDDLPEMEKIALNHGCTLTFDPAVNQGISRELALSDIRLTPEEVVNLDMAQSSRVREWIRLYIDYPVPESRQDMLFQCNAGRGNFHIDAHASLSCCIMCRTPSYDLRKGSFKDGWVNMVSRTQEEKWTKQVECIGCDDRILCHQCPGHAMLEHNDREKKIEYFCKIARLRKKKIIHDAVMQRRKTYAKKYVPETGN